MPTLSCPEHTLRFYHLIFNPIDPLNNEDYNPIKGA